MSNNKRKDEKDELREKKEKKAANDLSKSKDGELSDSNESTASPQSINELPSEMRRTIQSIVSLEGFAGTIPSLLSSKINEKHIDKILDIGEKDSERIYKDNQNYRKFLLVYLLIGVSLFVFLTLFLAGKDTELFKDIIKLFIAFVGGMGAGYGLKGYIGNK